MRNGSAAVWTPTSAHTQTTRRNPEGDFAATYVNTPAGRRTGRMSMDQIPMLTEGRLSEMTNGMFVTVRGIIDSVRLFESAKDHMPPRATIRMESGTGAVTHVSVTGEQYDRIWGFLVMGRTASLCGTVVRSPAGGPEHIALSRLWLDQIDLLTPETYALHQSATPLAVSL